MSDGDRLTYQDLKDSGLSAYFDGCKSMAIKRAWSFEQVLSYVVHAHEDGFDDPLENLMWDVVVLVISGGWVVEYYEGLRRRVSDVLSRGNLDEMIARLPADEAESFRHDLAVLGLISS